ncbi:MAG TPA: alpha/beta hydrolase, partial [Rhodothermales bacterium]|nr:alpha/beta hydrolase [Rhodothermales bacterium]
MPHPVRRPRSWPLLFAVLITFTLLLPTLIPTAHAQDSTKVVQSDTLPPGARVLKDIAYVAHGHARQKLDLYLPAESEKPRPLIIFIHGATFRDGDKADVPALRYVRQGYAIASVNYRLSQDAVFPAQIEDCKAAVRYLRANAGTYRLDPDHFGVWGISAGGYLAAMLGTAGDRTEWDGVGGYRDVSSRVQAVVDWYGPTDFLQMDAHRTPTGVVHDAPDSPESQLIGGPIQEHPDLVADANPAAYATADDPPFVIVHGLDDPLVPHHQSLLLFDALLGVGNNAALLTLLGQGHGGEAFDTPEIIRAMD